MIVEFYEINIFKMDKSLFFQYLLSSLRKEVSSAVDAAKDAAEYFFHAVGFIARIPIWVIEKMRLIY